MQSEFLNIVFMPFEFFVSIIYENPFNFADAFILLIFISAVFRYILLPIIGYNLGSVGSDYVAKKKFERNSRFRRGG